MNEQGQLDRIRILDGTTLKLIAMLSMVVDHVGDLFFPTLIWMRVVGRIAMPIFAFFIAEGYSHTRDRRRYLLRLGLFALISELPFDLAFSGRPELGHQNIMLTFSLAVLALVLYEAIRERFEGKAERWGAALALGAVFCAALIALLVRADYNLLGVLLVFVFYFFRGRSALVRQLAAVIIQLLLRNRGVFALGFLSFFPLMLYNGKRGRGLKWLFYLFYPGHLLLLYLLRR